MALIYDRELWPRQSFDPSCPSGGSWYACTTGSRFVGCCTGTTDPCDETTSCPHKNLRPASFDVAEYGTFSDEACDADSNWYTCAGTNPAFMGCCKSNPCSSGCPTKDLTAASLSVEEAVASAFITTPAAAVTSTGTATTTPAAVRSFSAGDHVGAIAGGTVGGVAGIALIVIGIIWCLKRRNQARREERERQRMAEDYKNDDGHFHNTHTPRQADTPREFQPEDDEEPRRTVYSMEDPEGLEVDDRPQQATSTRPSTADQHLTSNTQPPHVSPNVSRPPSANNPPSVGPPPSIGASWFTRDSIFTNGSPYLASIPSPDEQRRVSWIEQARHNGNNSPMITPIHSPLHKNQPDYFGAFENHQRQTSQATQHAISPQNQRFELDDTQLSPPVELEAIEATPKKQGTEDAWQTPLQGTEDVRQTPLQEPAQRRGRHDVEAGQIGSAYFSPDDVGKP
ncbi:hypothetical protein E4T39_07335 [Aureobasidium subglaciale]|nr:hypothetical protein E4T39_07335 [Aureobasidium subglaciale]